MYGTVTIPAALSGGKLSADMTTDKMPLKDAFRGAIRIGNEMKPPSSSSIRHRSGRRWGDLYRVT